MSHFSNIGFEVNSREEFIKLCQKVSEKCQKSKAKGGAYLQYSDQSGAELWLQVNFKNDLIGANPYFSGKSKRTVRLISKHKKEPSELDGYFMCEALAPEDAKSDNIEKENMLYPFAFDIPDSQALPEIKFPMVNKIQLSAFAHEIHLFKDEKEFEEKSGLNMAPRSFIPSGLFNPGDGKKTEPEAVGIFVGEVKETQLKTNSFSNNKFYWMLVDTFGGEVDVVANHNQLETEPQKGNLISGQFWLTGRLLGLQNKKEGFFQKLFG